MGCTGGAHVRSVARNRHGGASAHSASAFANSTAALTWMSSQSNCAKVSGHLVSAAKDARALTAYLRFIPE